jgi:RNA polymerase sigma-70 factor (ECF subfamily)
MEVTELLAQWSEGNRTALNKLAPIVYDELLRLARLRLSGERSDLTLQPTALVHEVYLKLVDQVRLSWKDRTHFFAIAATIMRRILIDDARRRRADKRGGGVRVTLNDEIDVGDVERPDVFALDLALQSLAQIDERKSRIIELKYFGGLTTEEISEVTGLSVATIGRDLRLAHACFIGRSGEARRSDFEAMAVDREYLSRGYGEES